MGGEGPTSAQGEGAPVRTYLDDSGSQILSPDSFYAHPDYPMDSYRISKSHGVTPMGKVSAINVGFF